MYNNTCALSVLTFSLIYNQARNQTKVIIYMPRVCIVVNLLVFSSSTGLQVTSTVCQVKFASYMYHLNAKWLLILNRYGRVLCGVVLVASSDMADGGRREMLRFDEPRRLGRKEKYRVMGLLSHRFRPPKDKRDSPAS